MHRIHHESADKVTGDGDGVGNRREISSAVRCECTAHVFQNDETRWPIFGLECFHQAQEGPKGS